LLYHAGGEIFWKAAIRKSGGDVTAALTLWGMLIKWPKTWPEWIFFLSQLNPIEFASSSWKVKQFCVVIHLFPQKFISIMHFLLAHLPVEAVVTGLCYMRFQGLMVVKMSMLVTLLHSHIHIQN
jgi:hypothetical protein